MTMSKKHYNPGRVWPIVKIALGIVRKNPYLMDDHEMLKSMLKANIDELNHPERCANCGASMLEYVFEFDCLDAVMLLKMAQDVQRRLDMGLPFNEANQVRVQELIGATYSMKSRTTQMSKLGLVAKLRNDRDRHVSGTWVITKRGWDALKGRRVPKFVRVWRGKIEERYDEMTTISEAFRLHSEKVESLIRRKKEHATDYRETFKDYRPEQWYRMGDAHEGKLI